MQTHEFDAAVVGAVFRQAGLVGWRDTNLVEAARDAGLDLVRLRIRFPGKTAVLMRFGTMADQAALQAGAAAVGTARERLFDVVMARFDALQQHRDGVLSLMEGLRTDPGLTLLLYGATVRSMRWMLDAAGIPTGGVVGALRVQGMVAAWAYALRSWERDEGSDLPATMAALERALDRAMQAEGMLPGRGPAPMDDEEPEFAAAAPVMPVPVGPVPVAPVPVVPVPVSVVPVAVPGTVPVAVPEAGPGPVVPSAGGPVIPGSTDGPAVI